MRLPHVGQAARRDPEAEVAPTAALLVRAFFCCPVAPDPW